MVRVLVPILMLVAVCAGMPTEIQSTFLREVMNKLKDLRSVENSPAPVNIRLVTGLTVMSLIQKCEMYLYSNEMDPMQMVADYYFHKNHSDESVLDHACPVVILVAKEYMDADSEEEVHQITDRLLPLMEEAMCVNIMLNREIMEEMATKDGISLDDRLDAIEQGEEHLFDECKVEFEKNDEKQLVDELLNKLTKGDNSE